MVKLSKYIIILESSCMIWANDSTVLSEKRFYRFSFSSNIPEEVIRIPRKKPQQSPKTITALLISDPKKTIIRQKYKKSPAESWQRTF